MSLLAAAAAGAALAALACWERRRRTVAVPLAEVAAAAERLARGDLSARVPPALSGALGGLGTTVNLLAERFQHDKAELDRLEATRREFVANVSHELRTPLAAISAYAETLASGGLEDAEHRASFVREIEEAAARMGRLVDDLLSLSALESGRTPPAFEPLSLSKATAEVVAHLVPLAGKKSVLLRVEPFGDVPPVRADKDMLKRALSNLLDNAIKYSPERGVVRVAASAAAGSVTVSVTDDGPGIPLDAQPRLFERFYRVDKARSRELGGTGLGLAIVKHIVEVHGGSVSVESAPGRGSTFRFSLPAIAPS